jgi:hypothetical protein
MKIAARHAANSKTGTLACDFCFGHCGLGKVPNV